MSYCNIRYFTCNILNFRYTSACKSSRSFPFSIKTIGKMLLMTVLLLLSVIFIQSYDWYYERRLLIYYYINKKLKKPAWLCLNRGSLAKRPLDRSEISICIFIQEGFYLNSVPLFTVNKAFYANQTGRTQMRKILRRAVIVSETIRKQKFKTFIMQPIREKWQ